MQHKENVDKGQPLTESRSSGAGYASPLRLFTIIAATVFFGEVLVMLILAVVPETPTLVEAFIDGFMITLFVTPALVLFLIRPMARTISQLETTEEKLRNLNRELEGRVAERTADLSSAVEQLKREIADRRQAENGLTKSAEFIERVFRSAPCILAIYDVNSLACSFVNDSTADLLGYSPDDVQVMGERFFETIFSPSDYAAFRALNARVAAGLEGEVLRCECALRDRDGEPRPFGIGIASAVSSSANQPKDVLLAAVPVGVAWPEFESERGSGGE